MKDLHHNVKVVSALDPVTLTQNTNGATIDLAGFESCEFIVQVGAATACPDADNKVVVTVQEGNESDLSDAATVDAAYILGTPPSIDAAGDKETEFKFGYVGAKRYVRLVFTETGTFSAHASAVAVLGHPRHAPVA